MKEKEQAPAPAAEAAAPRRKKKKLWLVPVIVLALAAAGVVVYLSTRGGGSGGPDTYVDVDVIRSDVGKTLMGKGTLKPANQYTVSTLVQGEILSADFEEGQMVQAGDVLYEINSADLQSEIEQRENALAQAELSLANRQLSLGQAQRSYGETYDTQFARSGIAGTLVSFAVKVGDEVTKGAAVATVRDSSVMKLKVPFPSDDAAGFYPGQSAAVTLNSTFERLPATVTEVSAADTVGAGNMLTRAVTVEVANPGALTKGQSASVEIAGVYAAASAALDYRAERTVTAEATGKIVSLLVQEGDAVTEGQAVATLGGDLSNEMQNKADNVQTSAGSVQDAELSLENARSNVQSSRDKLKDYTILSPISGTVVEKKKKAGDKISSNDSADSRTLCVIYDLSYLELQIDVDELDINALSVGSAVKITAQAAEGREYEGVVTRKGINGTTKEGVTSYPVTVRLTETEGLLPGMNVDARILVEVSENALAIPGTAVERGDVVLVTKDSPSAVNALPDPSPVDNGVYVHVETGLTDDYYVEIVSGLTEGDKVLVSTAAMGVGGMDFDFPYGDEGMITISD